MPTNRGRPPEPITRERLERLALDYLNRFDSSESNLRRRLLSEVERARKHHETDVGEARRLIDELVARYRNSAVLDDRRYAEGIARRLRTRGASRAAIAGKLRARGVPDAVIDALFGSARDAFDSELAAAVRLVRRRKLGPHRPPGEREARRRRDLGVLARAGFNSEIARRALSIDGADDDELF